MIIVFEYVIIFGIVFIYDKNVYLIVVIVFLCEWLIFILVEKENK